MKELVYHHFLLPAAERAPDQVAVLDTGFTPPMRSTWTGSVALSDGLRTQLGVGRGERYAVMALNGHAFSSCTAPASSARAPAINTALNLRLARRS